jgi:hypothetical protein
VAHLTDGTLRRMVDEPDARTAADTLHLESCAECQARHAAAADDARAIANLLAVQEPAINVSRALDRVRSAPSAQSRFGFRLPVLRPSSRPVMIAFAAAVAAVALIATAIAQDGTQFSPNTVTTVPVTVADMQSLSQLSAYGTVTWTDQPQLQVVTSAADAKSLTGLEPPAASDLPAGVSTTVTYAAMTKAVAVFTFSSAKAAASAAAAGKSLPALPAGIEGAQLTVSVGPAVGEVFGNIKAPSSSSASSGLSAADLPQLVIIESSAPTATSTQVTVKQLEDYLLAQPGISTDLAAAIRAIDSPGTTLPIPIPIQYATSTNVTINGFSGVALGDNTGLGSGVIWLKHGVLYAVAGTIKQLDALNIARNLR